MIIVKNFSNYKKFIVFIIFVILSSILFSYLFSNKFPNIIDNQNNMIFENINFGNGPLILNLINNGEYSSKFFNNLDFVLQKLPVLPLLIFSISKLTINFYLIVIIKNLITFSILFWIIIFYLKSHKLSSNYSFFYFLIFLIPYNLFVSLNFEYADNIVAILLPCLFLVLLSNLNQKYALSAFIIFILYLTKTSMFFVCTIIPFIILLFEKKKNFNFKKNLIFLGPLIAMLCWGIFSYIKTDRVAFGTNSLTVNSLGLTLASDKRFFQYYPDKSMDLLLGKIIIPKSLKSEWDIFDYFKKKNKKYFANKDNLINYIKTIPKKILIILFHIKRDSSHPDENGNYDNKIRYSLIFNKLFINISICLSLFYIIISIKRKKIYKDDFIFATILGMSLLPLVAGWATAKHLVPVSILCYYYLVHKYLIIKQLSSSS